MSDRIVRATGVEIACETFGAAGDPPVLLVMGATASMLGWPDGFCAALAEQEHFVLRFDHRDTGRSTTVPPGEAAYHVEDLAAEACAVLDGYGLARAHVVGMSLGGYIGQMLALEHPERVATLTLVASEPLGWDGAPLPHIEPAILEHFAALATLDWTDEGAAAAFLAEIDRLCAGPAHPFDPEAAERRARAVPARSHCPASMFNHAALSAREDWTGRFREIDRPTLVIHGERDPVLPLPNGEALANGIPGADLLVLKGAGHELPEAEWPTIAARIAGHARRDAA